MSPRAAVVLVGCVGLLSACGGAGNDSPPATDAGHAPADGGMGASCATTSTETRRDLRYRETPGVAAALQSLDVYRPVRAAGCPPTPVMIWVHGGGWSIGDKANQMADKVRWFMGRGWMLVSVNYRLSPRPPARIADLAPGRVMYPTHNEDVAAAVAWVRAEAASLGVDPARISMMGHSAGAGIVSQVVTNPRFLPAGAAPLRCAITLDTEAYDIPEVAVGDDTQALLYQNAFGTDPAVWREASALTHARAGLPRFFVVTRGTPARVAMSERFGAALRAVGVGAEVLRATGLDHEGVNDAIGRSDDAVITPRLGAWLAGCE